MRSVRVLSDSLPVGAAMETPFWITRAVNDVNGNPVYIGLAVPGTAVNAPGWQIRYCTYDVNQGLTSVSFAGGDANFDKVWNDYATYVYS